MHPALVPILLGGPPGWVRSQYGVLKPSLAFDFQGNNAWVNGAGTASPASLLSTSRASTGYAQWADGHWSSFGNNIPRITDQGILIEEARTNGIRNNSMVGAVVGTIGSGGVYPTNWGPSNSATTKSIVGFGTDATTGLPYIDIRFQSASATTTSDGVYFDTTTQIAATNGQTWTGSAFVAIVGGSLSNISSVTILVAERTSGGGSVRFDFGPNFMASLTATPSRIFQADTLSGGATVAMAQPGISFLCTSGSAIDITLRIIAPQMELGAFATSPILTTNAAATRAGDVITLIGPALAAMKNSSGFSVFMSLRPMPDVSITRYILAETGSNRFFYDPSTNGGFNAYNGTTILTGFFGSGSFTATGANIAGTFKSTGRTIVGNGGVVATDSAVNPTPSSVSLGGLSGSASVNTYVKRLAVFPPLPNSRLSQLAVAP